MLAEGRRVAARVAGVVVQHALFLDRDGGKVAERGTGVVGALQIRQVGQRGVAVVHDRTLHVLQVLLHLGFLQCRLGQVR